MIQMDDDLIVDEAFWNWLNLLKPNEFALCKVGEHLSSRIFAIHLSDFWHIGGMNPNLKFVFEDSEFALRAQRLGLKLRIIPSKFYVHINHPRRRYHNLPAFNWEYCHMFVKYKRHVIRNLFEFFWRPFDWRIKLQDLVTKIPFTIYWIVRNE
jgi:GT2 family glycosyltransferase